MSEARRKTLAIQNTTTKVSLLERIARAIDPKDRPAPRTHSAEWGPWRKRQAPLYSRLARYFPTPTTIGDRMGIKFRDGSVLIRRADGSLRRPFPRVRRTGRIRRAEKALRRVNRYRESVALGRI